VEQELKLKQLKKMVIQSDIYVQAEGAFWEMKAGKQRYKFQLPNATEADFSSLTYFEAIIPE